MIEWLTLDELSQYLKVSRAYLYKAAQEGQIPAKKVGRSWRFDRNEVDQSIKGISEKEEFPWSDCLDYFLKKIQNHFGSRFSSLWIYGSWARGDARDDSDVDLMVVLTHVEDLSKDLNLIISLAYEATFGRSRPVFFSTTLTDQKTFISDMEPLLLNIRREGKKAA